MPWGLLSFLQCPLDPLCPVGEGPPVLAGASWAGWCTGFLSPLGGGGIGCPAWAAGLKLRRELGLRAGAEGQVLTDEMLVGGRSGSGGRMNS